MNEREMTLKEWVEKLPESHLAHREYKELIEDQELLNALRSAGVDNWEGYDIVMEEHYN